jgi:hypothetical protein
MSQNIPIQIPKRIFAFLLWLIACPWAEAKIHIIILKVTALGFITAVNSYPSVEIGGDDPITKRFKFAENPDGNLSACRVVS